VIPRQAGGDDGGRLRRWWQERRLNVGPPEVTAHWARSRICGLSMRSILPLHSISLVPISVFVRILLISARNCT
jgi:hypothetical protein